MLDTAQQTTLARDGFINAGPVLAPEDLAEITSEYDQLVTPGTQVLGNERDGFFPYRAMLNFRSPALAAFVLHPSLVSGEREEEGQAPAHAGDPEGSKRREVRGLEAPEGLQTQVRDCGGHRPETCLCRATGAPTARPCEEAQRQSPKALGRQRRAEGGPLVHGMAQGPSHRLEGLLGEEEAGEVDPHHSREVCGGYRPAGVPPQIHRDADP